MSKYNKEELEKYIFEDNMPYDKIGDLYDVSGSAIRKAAKRLGIELPKRRKVNPKETFNKGTGKKFCLNCGNYLTKNSKYCNNTCQGEYEYNTYIKEWKLGLKDGMRGAGQISSHIRKYLFDKYENKCQKCEWGEVNVNTGKIPLQVHHIDGDALNNKEENLELICPNCHSLTETYGGANKNSTRKYRYNKKD